MTIYSFNMAMELAGKAVLGYSRAKKEQWISTSTWDKTGQRKERNKKSCSPQSPQDSKKDFQENTHKKTKK